MISFLCATVVSPTDELLSPNRFVHVSYSDLC